MGLPLNLLGRINHDKMMHLPWFNYVFHNCPILYQLPFSKKLIAACTLIWNGASPRLARTTSSLPQRLGELAMPDFRVCFWAADLVWVFWWFQGSRSNAAPCLEASFLGSLLDLQDLIYRGLRAYTCLPGQTQSMEVSN